MVQWLEVTQALGSSYLDLFGVSWCEVVAPPPVPPQAQSQSHVAIEVPSGHWKEQPTQLLRPESDETPWFGNKSVNVAIPGSTDFSETSDIFGRRLGVLLLANQIQRNTVGRFSSEQLPKPPMKAASLQ